MIVYMNRLRCAKKNCKIDSALSCGKALVVALAGKALAMCAMCAGFPNCPAGQKRAGKNKINPPRIVPVSHYCPIKI